MIHNHGPEEGPGLACNELRLPFGIVKGACLLPEGFGNFPGFCNLSDECPPHYKGLYVWCVDHNLPADHVGTDGDTPICMTHADTEGCNCCPKNYNRESQNFRLYKMAWDLLLVEEQNELRELLQEKKLNDYFHEW